jgi:dCMP deaminase
MEEKFGRIRPDWDEYFMLSAAIIGTRSSCSKFNSGAVIVKNKRIVSSGYNGNPPGVPSSWDVGFCRKDKAGIEWGQKGSGHCLATHAEANAIVQNHEQSLEGATMYCLHFPCNECAKLIISSGIKEVVYLKMYRDQVPRAEEMFNQSGVKFRQMSIDYEEALKATRAIFEQTRE